MEVLLFFVSTSLALVYVRLLYRIMDGWDETEEWSPTEADSINTNVTVIVPARNESGSIVECLKSILNQNYPCDKLAVIAVDDESTDDTRGKMLSIDDPRLHILRTSNGKGGKKNALTQAIGHAKTDVVLCTDGDSQADKDWLLTMVSYYEKERPYFIAGPIIYETDRSLLQRFQYLDGVGNMAVTAAGIKSQSYYMANGANMLFSKKVFTEVGGFYGDTIASGDDMMLIQKIAKRYPDKVKFLKTRNGIYTSPVRTLKELISQRKRWATKTQHYQDKGIVKVQAVVFAMVMTLVVNILLIPFTEGFSFFTLLMVLVIKLSIDFLYLKKMAIFYGNTKPLKHFLPASFIFVCYILWAAFSAFMPSSYEWKGRRVE